MLPLFNACLMYRHRFVVLGIDLFPAPRLFNSGGAYADVNLAVKVAHDDTK